MREKENFCGVVRAESAQNGEIYYGTKCREV